MTPLKKVVMELVALAESGDTKQLGKSIMNSEVFDLEYLEACTRILMKANAEMIKLNQDSPEKNHFHKAGITLIEVLVQKKAAEDLVKLAFLSWNTLEKSPLSVRCLDSAIGVGPLNDLYEIGHLKLSHENPKFVECAANLILKLAEAGCRVAFFITGQILLEGDGVQKNVEAARKWFLKAAMHGSSRAVSELDIVPKAYLELAKLYKKPILKNFFLQQAEICRKACEDLSVSVPGMEIESLISNGENGKVEFKECAVWEIEILRDVAAFLNSNGGSLFIGVEDKSREAVGLAKSFEAAKVKNKDLYERHMTETMLSNYGADCSEFLFIDFPMFKGQEICRISISPSTRPVFVQEKNNEKNFYVRSGNSKRKLTTEEAIAYCKKHFIK